jgi:hypothetical protein
MDKKICPTCYRSEGDLHPGGGKSESREVSLASIDSAAAADCSLCFFVKELLARDKTTPENKKDDNSYESAKVRVDGNGLRFTGQWQGALVTEIYSPGKSALLILEEAM